MIQGQLQKSITIGVIS